MPLLHTLTVVSAGLAAAVALTACGGSEPLASGETEAIVIGSQDYYSNEIIAEIYAQALESAGHEVVREFRIGQREVYVPEIESGAIDLFPEYSGPLLQYWEPDTQARLADEVYAALRDATPEGLRLLDQSPATDQDSYTVTRAFAEQWGLETIADLAAVSEPLTLGGNSEGEARPNGPSGLEAAYGVSVAFTPIEDGGGPLTVKALQDGDIQLAIIYTADPSMQKNDLVSLEDTEGLFLASHVVPVASDDIDDEAAAIINAISAAMSADDLVGLNLRSVDEELAPAQIAADWLAAENLN
ncbi:ABC transporter substrate-binding protein [Tessaracoccus sp. MC1627]|uniref:ABC transporter substrate-binding protein n=1 Tax=Tessaracoccus sp. MC1627 TaxID=2760312 RepID=UPI0015FFF7E1|nr:ABC transporter substrate-binding protein [Tessaracoccus sp. MC1627]MBB1511741.1 ABC transporter substrate-binding protein [Tessaracoccus sp. MC1627]